MNAIWITDYDFSSEKLYKCPGCPRCEDKIGKFGNVYKCFCCGEFVEVADEKMKTWLEVHEETKTACRKMIDYYGIQAQKIKLMEELAALILATAKAPADLVTDSMIEEIADVHIMLKQFGSVLTHDQDRFMRDLTEYKLRRQLTRMEGE